MTGDAPRVAFFPDTYYEIDGVANTSRHFEAFAARRGLPWLTVCGGDENQVQQDRGLIRMVVRRGPFGFPLDQKHDFDLAFWRHYRHIEAEVRKFGPDIVHITGPSDVGQLGALVAHRLGLPLAASWHTNLHEYAEQRAGTLFGWMPPAPRGRLCRAIRRMSLRALLRFYKIAHLLFAPNPELIGLLEKGTGKACHLMPRGVDTTLFDPRRRNRTSNTFVLGYVGRLTTEKNVRFLAELEHALRQSGLGNFRFSVVGQGSEGPWLKSRMQHADFAGVLHGEALARAYANMDVFVFPSQTDTYGNVVLEALASGVPAVVMDRGGPRFIIRAGETGFVAKNQEEFVAAVQMLAMRPREFERMRKAARNYADTASWDRVFESVYSTYDRWFRVYAKKRGARHAPEDLADPTPTRHQTYQSQEDSCVLR